jgi:hypothetical protein
MEARMKKRSLGLLALATACLIPAAARADQFPFSFTDGSVTVQGTMFYSNTPVVVDGVKGYEVTGIWGYFSDSNVGVSGAITGLYSPISYNTTPGMIAFSSAGNSYDDLLFPAGNSPADCPPPDPYPFSGGVFDVLGVLFNVQGGYTGELWSQGIIPPDTAPVYGAAIANASTDLDYATDLTATPEPSSVFMLGTGLIGVVGLLMWKRQRDSDGANA